MKNIEALPTVIFQLIQSYCPREGYRKLMNTNQANFKTVKFETVYFNFKIRERFDQQEEDTFCRLMNRVMDKSKQISMVFTEMQRDPMILLTNVWDGIEKLTLRPPPYTWYDLNFSFQAFQNIIDLNLENIHGISNANLNLEKTRKLKLLHCGFEEITAWNSQSSLTDVTIDHCESLHTLPAFENISSVVIYAHGDYLLEFQVGRQKKLVFHWSSISLQTLQNMSNHSMFAGCLRELSLRIHFPLEFNDFSFCQNIPLLSLEHCTIQDELYADLPKFPVYYGKNISLNLFCVDFWFGKVLRNVETCNLISCLHEVELPEMPNLHSFLINQCDIPVQLQIEEIRNFPLLRTLLINACQNLGRIGFYPNLSKAKIVQCDNLNDVSGLTTVRNLEIKICPCLTIVPSLKNIENLKLENCETLSDLSHLSWSDVPKAKRTVCISDLPLLVNITFCKNICSLELSELPGLVNCHGIENVHELQIKRCDNLITTEGLVNITRKLCITYCPILYLSGVKGIPVLEVYYCSSFKDLDSLGNHEVVRIQGCPLFDPYVEEYQKEHKHEAVFTTIQHLFLLE
jgi:hypothetical protein